MRVVHLSYTYGQGEGGGAAIAASRLHETLIDAGVESHFICLLKHGEGRNVHVLPKPGLACKIYFLLAKVLRAGWKLTPFRRVLGTNLLPLPGLKQLLDSIEPDVIHLHWLNFGVASQEALSKLPYPIVANLHDLWPIDALNFHPGTDRRLIEGYTRENSNWVERWMINRKRRFAQQHPVSFIGPSKWVVDVCRKSVVGKGCMATAIPNIINPIFSYDPGLAVDKKHCLFLYGCDGGFRNVNKGFDDVRLALRMLTPEEKSKVELHVFGQTEGDSVIEGVRVVYEGYITDPERLKRVYHSADVFLFPSKQETQGMTKIEAMLCGLPVIAFDRTACAEGIVEGETGWVVPDGDHLAFARAMIRAAALKKDRQEPFVNRAGVARKASQMFAAQEIVAAVLAHYKRTIAVWEEKNGK